MKVKLVVAQLKAPKREREREKDYQLNILNRSYYIT